MKIFNHRPIIIPETNNQNEICDHTDQTAHILKENHPVYIFFKNLPPVSIFKFINKNNVRVIKFLPFNRFSAIFKINSYLTFNYLYIYTLIKHRQRPTYWIFYPSLASTLKFSFRPYNMVFDILDGFISTPEKNKYLLKSASIVSVMSKTLLKYYKSKYGEANYLLTHPASKLIIPKKKYSTTVPSNTVGYLGAINERLDFPLIHQVIKSTPNITYLFAGPINHDENISPKPVNKLFNQILTLPNAKYLGVLPKDNISIFLEKINLGIIPYDIYEIFNHLSFPLKSIEYLLANKPVLSTTIDELLFYPNLFKIADSPDLFIKQIHTILSKKTTSVFTKSAKIFCLRHTWKHKINLIEKSL